MAQWLKRNPPANLGDTGLIPGSGRSPGEGNGYPLAWEIPWTRGASQSVVHEVTKGQTWLSD